MRNLYFCTKCWRNHDLNSKIGGDHAKHALTLRPELEEAMDKACMKYQTYAPDLIVRYVKQGLVRDGVLEVGN